MANTSSAVKTSTNAFMHPPFLTAQWALAECHQHFQARRIKAVHTLAIKILRFRIEVYSACTCYSNGKLYSTFLGRLFRVTRFGQMADRVKNFRRFASNSKGSCKSARRE
jgi:hypothetical protein